MTEQGTQERSAEKQVTDELANEAHENSKHGDNSPTANQAKDKRAEGESRAQQGNA